MRILITLTLFFYCCLCCHGNEGLPQNPPDSILPRGERFFTNRWVHSTYIGLPLVVGGLMQVHHNKMFRHYRNTSVPRFKVKADDYLQYSPAIVMVGLKAAGVKGRSPIGKMLVPDAFSTALMAPGVNGMKYTVRLMRPDGNTWDVHSGGYIALEGAWYWNSHFGVGGQIGQSNILYNKHDDTTTQTDDAYTDATRNISFLPGIYFQQPLIHRLSLQAHINMGGTRWFKTPRKLLKGEPYLGFSGMIGAPLKLRTRTPFLLRPVAGLHDGQHAHHVVPSRLFVWEPTSVITSNKT